MISLQISLYFGTLLILDVTTLLGYLCMLPLQNIALDDV